ncbi:hypothetical protein PXH66_03305 [Synoicihabitans lomoniglobus]|uniref:Uncharacterized protein n=1 Tax=Synoicihabitans lomoniglobus TaxID=2909285 RepID=A0AAF0CPX2_9BACT|nr:hypothetical protein PXH66_03305 [Opitutaceae bacterium LMO-M01]
MKYFIVFGMFILSALTAWSEDLAVEGNFQFWVSAKWEFVPGSDTSQFYIRTVNVADPEASSAPWTGSVNGDNLVISVIHDDGTPASYASKLANVQWFTGDGGLPITVGILGPFDVLSGESHYIVERVYSTDNATVPTYVKGERIHQPFPVGSNHQNKTVRLSLRNTRDVAVTYRLIQDGSPVGEITLQPGQAVIQEFEVPSYAVVTVVEEIPDLEYSDDQWMVVDGALTELDTGVEIDPELVLPGDELPEPVEVPQSDKAPTATTPEGVTQNNDAPIWSPNTDTKPNDALTNATYKSGVANLAKNLVSIRSEIQSGNSNTVSAINSLKAAIEGDGSGPEDPTVPDETDVADEVGLELEPSGVLAIENKLPELVSIEGLGSVSVFAFSLPMQSGPDLAIDIDFSDYETGITIFKALVRGALAIWFFFMSLRAIREAFAT